MAVTIRDVAAYCGLSISAVSKALNNYPDVNEDTRQRVLQAAKDIGYFPNALARGLKTKRTYNLGVILDTGLRDDLLHPYFVTILSGFKHEAERQGYDITMVNHNIGKQALSYLNHCLYRNVDGVCLMCVDFFSPEIAELVQSTVPLVTVDHLFSSKDCVLSDNKAGIRDILNYLFSMGHTRIAFIHGSTSSVTDARLAAFYEGIHAQQIKLPAGYVIPGQYNSTDQVQADVRKLLALPEPPTCILMTDDSSALSGMEAIQSAGLRVPEDISIVGYDGVELIQKIHPRLTTVRQNGEEIGRLAALRLIDRLDSPEAPVGPPDVVAGELIMGETVREIKA